MEKIAESRNIERAWRKVKANGGAPGPDGVSLEEFFLSFRSAVADDSTTTFGWDLPATTG